MALILRFLPAAMASMFAVFLYIIFPSYAASAERLELTLKEAVEHALRENLSLKTSRYSIPVAEAGITEAAGEFDPAFNMKLSNAFTKRLTPSILLGTEESSLIADLSFGGKLKTGATYELKWSNERIKSNLSFLTLNPYYSSEFTLTLKQPLLKGFGTKVQESSLNMAKNNLDISKLRNAEDISSIIYGVSEAYWELYYARENLSVAEMSLRLAENIFEETWAKIETGMLAPVEIYKAEAEVALRHETLMSAKKSLADREDALRSLMNLDDWDIGIIAVEEPPPPSMHPSLEEAMESALKNRRDYKQALIERKNKEIQRVFYGSQKYPALDVFASAGLNGLSGDFSDALGKFDSADYYSWQMGFSLTVPLGNRAARGNYLKAKHEEERAASKVEELKQKIMVETREAWRALGVWAEMVESSKKVRISAHKRLEAEEERFRVGMATLNDALRFQEEYAKALSSEKRARVNYAVALVDLEKAKGTLEELVGH